MRAVIGERRVAAEPRRGNEIDDAVDRAVVEPRCERGIDIGELLRARQQHVIADQRERRGRVVLLFVFVSALFTAISIVGGESAATRDKGTPQETRLVVVGERDTLWGIASEVAAPGEVREMAHRIRQLNALPSSAITEGQELAVPLGD